MTLSDSPSGRSLCGHVRRRPGGPRSDQETILVRYGGSVLEIKPMGFADRLDMGFVRNRSTKDSTKVFDLNIGKMKFIK